MPKRRAEQPFPIENEILAEAHRLSLAGWSQFHGYELKKAMGASREGGVEPGTSTLYRALLRLEDLGWLSSSWEDPAVAHDEGRPPRRLYRLTMAGVRARAGVERATPRAMTDRGRPAWREA